MTIRISTYEHSKDIPDLPGTNIFHSTDLFQVLEQTPGYRPVLLVAWENDTPIGKLLCITRRNARLTGLRKKTYAYGTGEYFNTSRKADEIFGNFLSYFTIIFQDQSFFLEFRNLEEPLFGYRYFRQNGYFPVHWLRVRNSIHHQTLDKWISASRKRQIARGLKNGATMDIARTQEDIEAFFNMLRKYYAAKIHRYLPDLPFFLSLLKRPSEHELGKIFLIRYKNKVIGGSVCLFSQNTAYLLFSSGMRKTYPLLYPGVLAVWNAMTYSRQQGYRHFEFIEAGLPFKKYTYRDFILRFGGRQLSTRRWFRIRWKWLNRLLIHFYI